MEQEPVVTSMSQILSPIYYLSCSVGLSLFSLKTFSFKLTGLLYIFLLSLPFGYNIWLLYIWVQSPSDLPKTAIFFIVMNDSFVYMLAAVSWSMVMLKYNKFVESMKQMITIYSDIKQICRTVHLETLRKTQLKSLISLILLLLLKYCADYAVNDRDSHWLGYYLADAANNVVVMQLTNLLWLLRACYANINSNIQIKKRNRLQSDCYMLNEKEVAYQSPPRRTNTINRPPVDDTKQTLKVMRTVLGSVHSLSNLVNSIFSLQLLLYMGNFVIEITVSLYVLYYAGVYKVDDSDLVRPLFWVYILSEVLVILLDAFQIVILINASEDVTNEVRSVADTNTEDA